MSIFAFMMCTIVFATTDNKFDDELYNFLLKLGANVFRGSEFDLLDRYYNAAKQFKSTHFVRMCGDNPFISSEEIDNLINFYLKNSYEYVYNHRPLNNTYPGGFGGEIASFEILSYVNLFTFSCNIPHIFFFWIKRSLGFLK